MKLVSVDRALKELQNDTLFPTSCLVQALYLVKFTSRNFKVPVPVLNKRVYLHLQQYKAQPNEKGIIL